MPPTRKLEDRIEEHEALLATIMDIARKGGDVVKEITRFQNEGTNHCVRTMTVKEFSLEGAVVAFGLQYSNAVSFSEPRVWNIEEIPETKYFKPSPCLKPLIESYSRNFDRTSEAVCRTAVDFILNECLTVMKRNTSPESPPSSSVRSSIASSHAKSGDQMTLEHSLCSMPTPPPSLDIKVFGEVSFSHRITPADGQLSPYTGVTVNGRVDYGIGRTVTSPCKSGPGKRRFQSLLLLVEAKTAASIDAAFTQLVVYLGSLHQSRLSRNRSDASVYGIASDGYIFTFVTITHEGVLKQSNQFNITARPGDLEMVLGCLKYLLEKSASMTPDLTPERGGDDDPAIDVDDNEFMKPPLPYDD